MVKNNTVIYSGFVLVMVCSFLPTSSIISRTMGNMLFSFAVITYLVAMYVVEKQVSIQSIPSIFFALIILTIVFFYHVLQGNVQYTYNMAYPFYGVAIPVIFLLILPSYIHYRFFIKIVGVLAAGITAIGIPAYIYGSYDILWVTVHAVEYSEVTRLRSIIEASQNATGRILMVGTLFSFAEFTKKYDIIWFSLFAVNLLGLYLTGSRGALFGFLIGFGLYLTYHLFSYRVFRYCFLLGNFLILYLLLFILGVFSWPEAVQNIDFNNRFELWKATIDAVSNNAFIGTGLKSDSETIAPYLSNTGLVGNSPHSGYLSIMLSSGIIGLMSYLFIIERIVVTSSFTNDQRNAIMLSIVISFLVVGIVENVVFIGTGFNAILFSMSLGYLVFSAFPTHVIILE